jgi:hypothetical protein
MPVSDVLRPLVPGASDKPVTVRRDGYWRASRAPRYSLLLALPLLALYELLAAALGGGEGALRNGADVLLRSLAYSMGGARGPLVLGAAVGGLCLFAIVRDRRRTREPLELRIFALMLAEAAVLAVVTGVVVGVATRELLHAVGSVGGVRLAVGPMEEGTATKLMLSLGAGLYEELVFRVLLISLLAGLARWLLGANTLVAGVIAATVGALVFSAFHYVGAYGDPFTMQSFTFRALAGLFFSALYLLRGFGITAWTHALYDVLVLM